MEIAPNISAQSSYSSHPSFTCNMILANFLGMCSYLSVSSEFKTATDLGKAVVLVLVITNTVNWALNKFVIIPLHIEYLSFIIFIMVIAAIVQILEMFMDRYLPDLHAKLGHFPAPDHRKLCGPGCHIVPGHPELQLLTDRVIQHRVGHRLVDGDLYAGRHPGKDDQEQIAQRTAGRWDLLHHHRNHGAGVHRILRNLPQFSKGGSQHAARSTNGLRSVWR